MRTRSVGTVVVASLLAIASPALAGQPQQAPQSASQVKPASTEPQVQVSQDLLRLARALTGEHPQAPVKAPTPARKKSLFARR